MVVIICNQVYFLHMMVKKEVIQRNCMYKKRSRLDLRKYVFSNGVIDHWNALSDVCVTSIRQSRQQAINTIKERKNTTQ